MINLISLFFNNYRNQIIFFLCLFIVAGYIYSLNSQIEELNEKKDKLNQKLLICENDNLRANANIQAQNEAINKLKIKLANPKTIIKYRDKIKEIKVPADNTCKNELDFYKKVFKTMGSL